MNTHDVLAISGLETECVVGVYPHERGEPQPLRVDLDLHVDTEGAGRSARLSRTVDYDRMAQEIVFLLKSCRFGLLETAAVALASYVLSPPGPGERRAGVLGVRLKLIKPRALPRGAEASLEIRRESSWARTVREDSAFGSVNVVFESREASIFRVNIAPRRRTSMHRDVREHQAGNGAVSRSRRWEHAADFRQCASACAQFVSHLLESNPSLAIHSLRPLADFGPRDRVGGHDRRSRLGAWDLAMGFQQSAVMADD